MRSGWFNERYRHSLAAKGIKTRFSKKAQKEIMISPWSDRDMESIKSFREKPVEKIKFSENVPETDKDFNRFLEEYTSKLNGVGYSDDFISQVPSHVDMENGKLILREVPSPAAHIIDVREQEAVRRKEFERTWGITEKEFYENLANLTWNDLMLLDDEKTINDAIIRDYNGVKNEYTVGLVRADLLRRLLNAGLYPVGVDPKSGFLFHENLAYDAAPDPGTKMFYHAVGKKPLQITVGEAKAKELFAPLTNAENDAEVISYALLSKSLYPGGVQNATQRALVDRYYALHINPDYNPEEESHIKKATKKYDFAAKDLNNYVERNLKSKNKDGLKEYSDSIKGLLFHPNASLDKEWQSYERAGGKKGISAKDIIGREEERGAVLIGDAVTVGNVQPMLDQEKGRNFRETTVDLLFGREK